MIIFHLQSQINNINRSFYNYSLSKENLIYEDNSYLKNVDSLNSNIGLYIQI